MRHMYTDQVAENDISSISFYSGSEGFVAFRDWIGFSSDSGRTFAKKYVTIGNVDYGTHMVNLTFGFDIAGIHAFDANRIIVYGDYGLVPAILRSTDGGATFKLVFHSQFDPLELLGGINDLTFPGNGNIGYAIDNDRILKSTDRGETWEAIRVEPGSRFTWIEAPDVSTIFVGHYDLPSERIIKSFNAGISWTEMAFPPIPDRRILNATFIDGSRGWLNMRSEYSSNYYLYTTNNGGTSWTLQNDPDATPFFGKMKFADANTGYAITDGFTIAKTTDGGKIWEPLPRDSEFGGELDRHYVIQLQSADKLWAGGSHGFLEITTNGGGTPLPRAYFKTDTTNLAVTGIVHLVNFSKPGHSVQWLLNGTPHSNTYNSSFVRNQNRLKDTVQLIVTNDGISDTAVRYLQYHPPVVISSFVPQQAAPGAEVIITGQNFIDVLSVSFGGVPAASFTVESSNSIRAMVGAGASGNVVVGTQTGMGILNGFTFIESPIISSVSPLEATAGTIITIAGNFLHNTTQVKLGGVAANFQVISSNILEVTAPSGGSGNIEVLTSGGSASFNGYIALPQLTGFTPTEGTHGTIMLITGTSLAGVSSVTVGGIPVQSFVIEDANRIRAVVGAGGTGQVSVSKTGGTASLDGFVWYPPPSITSFNPISGPVGTTVTITGNNFDPIATNNIVYFGGVRAVVTGGNTNSLTVTVPAGATHDPIDVLSNHLLASSAQPFTVTFPDGGSLTANSFIRNQINTFPFSSTIPKDIRLSDVDGDGKLDIVMLRYTSANALESGIAIFRNTTTNYTTSFADPVFVYSPDGAYDIGDIDGDGKQDIVTSTGWDNKIAIYRNNSTPGIINFTAAVQITQANLRYVKLTDIDGDGKIDLLAGGGMSIYRNTSNPGSIAFADPYTLPNVTVERNFVVVDMDNDGIKDIVTSNQVIKNTSTNGNLSFGNRADFDGFSHSRLQCADLDQDGKPEIVIADIYGSKVVVYRNLSSVNTVSLSESKQFPATTGPTGIQISDLDGDGLVDVGLGLSDWNLAVLKNISTSGNIVLAPIVRYNAGYFNENILAIGDLNNDGKNDIVSISEITRIMAVYTNNVKPEPFISGISPTSGTTGTTITITGFNFTGITGVTIGGVPVASFVVNSANTITVIANSTTSGAVVVSNNYGSAIGPDFVYSQVPIINSFSPVQATAGTSITISGDYFSSVPANNIVYIGGARAMVTEASQNSLTVIAPTGATGKRISVTVNGLSAHSNQQFTLLFPGGGSAFTASSLGELFQHNAGGGFGEMADIDGDGRLDMASGQGNNMLLVRNTSTSGNISFAAPISTPTPMYSGTSRFEDIDGDGKLDILAINGDEVSISIFRNTSTIGSLTTASPIRFATGNTGANSIFATDLDGDGKAEVLVSNYSSRTVSVFKNYSTPGTIILGNRIDYLVNGYATAVQAYDLNGDRKPEIIAAANGNTIAIFPNSSTMGTISFANSVSFEVGDWPLDIEVADFDNDTKMDIAVMCRQSPIIILQNTSTANTISFQSFEIPFNMLGRLVAGDLDGDGRHEIIAQRNASFNFTGVVVYKNNSSPGSLAFSEGVQYTLPGYTYHGAVADVDGDGVPDLVGFGTGGNTYILRNLIGAIVSVPFCPTGSATIVSDKTGASYQWQVDQGSGFTNLSESEHVSGSNTVQLQLLNIPESWNGFVFKCLVNGNDESASSRLLMTGTPVTPSIALTADATSICPNIPVRFTASPINGGTNPIYRWNVNGVITESNSPTRTISNLTVNSNISVTLESNATCAIPASVTSNIVAIEVKPAVVPSVTIEQNMYCAGAANTFRALPVNGGPAPKYTWIKNFVEVGTDAPTYTDPALNNGDRIQVLMTSDAECRTVNLTGSPQLLVQLTPIHTPIASIVGENVLSAGESSLVVSNSVAYGDVTYQWQDSTATHGWQTVPGETDNFINYLPISTGDRLRCIVANTFPCSSTNVVYSNEIEFAITGGRFGEGLIAPNPVNAELRISSLDPNDNWSTLEITDLNGAVKLRTSSGVAGQRTIQVNVQHLLPGVYVAILRGPDGKSLRLKFLKM